MALCTWESISAVWYIAVLSSVSCLPVSVADKFTSPQYVLCPPEKLLCKEFTSNPLKYTESISKVKAGQWRTNDDTFTVQIALRCYTCCCHAWSPYSESVWEVPSGGGMVACASSGRPIAAVILLCFLTLASIKNSEHSSEPGRPAGRPWKPTIYRRFQCTYWVKWRKQFKRAKSSLVKGF